MNGYGECNNTSIIVTTPLPLATELNMLLTITPLQSISTARARPFGDLRERGPWATLLRSKASKVEPKATM